MQRDVETIVRENYPLLPKKIKEFIHAPAFGEKILGIATRHGLEGDRATYLEDGVLLLLCGLIPPQDFVRHLSQLLNLPEEKVRPIAENINEQIFRPVQDELKKLYEISPVPTSFAADATRYSPAKILPPDKT